MNPITIQQAAVMAEGLLLHGNPQQLIEAVHFDSRQMEKNGLFVPIVGGERDGHDFIEQALQQGAAAVLVSNQAKLPQQLPDNVGVILVNDTLRAFQKLSAAYRRQFDFPFIAVTGSNGKTTTKDIIAYLLSAKMSVYRTYKNYNNHLGVPYSLLQLQTGQQAAVLELGMNHAGEIDLLASLVKPQISVITYIGDSHLEYFGSREKIALAKAELLPHTDPDGLVLLNGDNSYLRQISHLYCGKILYYSVNGPADIWAEQITPDQEGTRFTVHFKDGLSFPVYMPLFGRHNVLNTLPAIAIARHYGFSPEAIAQALAEVSLSAMRFEVLHANSGAIVINDAYNASPASMEAAISTFAEIFPQRERILVLGDMFELGADSEAMHAGVGRFADQFRGQFAMLVTIGTDSEKLSAAYLGNKRHFTNKQDALDFLQGYNTQQHAILIKASRGMKLESIANELLG
ncbi:UDP-N-acetylmuramoyl-tripeptide--D-alanyl-D-alanine ligase [Brevibacillus fulvus]|uniref:UDP-N-acetylmuramoyl-tripeptide--D-alanyl-D-alanine ligase n=1 Tax=Brevibacillus fulvus TaxID=1125967 RepID=A0A939BTV3_9BACL|nr:UDP-N-acetylmuramoyl-tripeptide--D-alanyl-D-alanine ligase [Brevibacillus fulvus]MBM7589864.1 UDP-N-acetylmuramoyl-tripeptide--D-alanyl-D-alanine ligase [Brevibacillus fulvus]